MEHRTPLAAFAAITASLAGVAAPASAHAILMSSTPPIDGAAPAGRVHIDLHYNSLIDVKRSRVVLTDPAGRQTVLKLMSTPTGDGMTAETVLQAGQNTLRWQVLAVDGHITRGDVPFKAEPAGAGGLAQGAAAGQ